MIREADWLHSDRTWCSDYNCPLISCIRNPKNIPESITMVSHAAFMLTEECPIYVMEMNAAQERDDEHDC